MEYDILLNKKLPVPPCEGPKLEAFESFDGRIEFIRLLSGDPDDPDNGALHSYVFEASIGKQRYALKIFKFYYAEEERYGITHPLRRNLSNKTLAFHSDPFFAECRAYGKINQYYEAARNGNRRRRRQRGNKLKLLDANIKPIAVPCYGYITLGDEYDRLLCNKFDVDWDRSEQEESGEIPNRPLRALVKQLVSSGVSVANPRRMLGNLKQLRKLGIFQRDVYARNYMDGLLVDFSVAWTDPHWCMKAMGPYRLGLEKYSDLRMFDAMIEEAGIKTLIRATPNRDYCQKLRSRDVEESSDGTHETESNDSRTDE
ncbi:kinetochore Sim4 complex subunit FTA2-domain-containing protein [Nemania sp. FL0031]|nr:kinetochore Sim4 complex subunit FTA2-domain-containing protein [Nemania sp. FL0031]